MDLWNFSLRTYGQAGVAPLCLSLQDRHGVDIPLMLWAAWTAASGRSVTTEVLIAADTAVREWRIEVIHPLRAIRQRMKSSPRFGPSPRTEAVREQVKAAELAAEKLELEYLATQTVPDGTAGSMVDALQLVVDHFADGAVDETAALLTIAEGARRAWET